MSNISFVAPTDSEARIQKIVKDSKKFIYMVAYTGITGSGSAEDLQPFLSSIKKIDISKIKINLITVFVV